MSRVEVPSPFSLKHPTFDTMLQSNLTRLFFSFFFRVEKMRLKKKKSRFMNEGTFTRTNTTLVTDPNWGDCLKTKCTWHAFNHRQSVTLICRPKNRCLRMCSRRRQRHWRLTFLFFLLYREFKSTWMLFPKSRACATCVCEWGGEEKKPETAFITSLHIVMRMRRGENEQRKPDLRGESELDRRISFFFSSFF